MGSEAAVAVPRLRLVRPGERTPAAARAQAERSMRRILAALSISVALLTLAGLVMVLSASSVSAFAKYGSSFLFFKRQLLYAVIGSVALLAASRVRYQVWQRAWVPLLAVSFVLLILVLHPSVGTVAGGAARWIQIGPVSFQPSELAKFAVVAACAAVLARNMKRLDAEPARWIVPIALIVGSVSLLILLQPDLGTMMVIALAAFLLLFLAGVRLRLLVTTAFFSGVLGFALIMGKGYRRTRFLSFLHPWSDPQHTGYQIVQSLIALGSGHLYGVGLGASRQKWTYVPNAHTDFIFAILGEELGLLGELIVLALFGAVVYAGIRIALRSPDAFGRLLAGGITAWLGIQALVNLGAVTGLLPITGVPLPFVSFGGSSLIVSLAAVGVLLAIGRAALATETGVSRTRKQG
ncbi:MAG: putative lipid II flippase FtsW [Actinomycetota bacterium]